MQSSRWQADNDVRRFDAGRMSGRVVPRDPNRGIDQLCIDGQPVAGAQLLRVDLAAIDPADPSPVEVVSRGDDLAVTYADRPAKQMRAQVYWRADGPLPRTAAKFELLVSVQTGLLDSCPRTCTRSHLPANQVLRWTQSSDGFAPLKLATVHRQPLAESRQPTGYLFRVAGTEFSYAEMVHPSDARETTVATHRIGDAPGGELAAEVGHELFADHLEKGVILRARVLGVVVDRADDEATAIEHFARFLSAKLPLTT